MLLLYSHVTLSSGVIIQFRVQCFYRKETFAGKQKKFHVYVGEIHHSYLL